jgi:N-acetylmuramoyl-L-alanine amidase
MIFLAIKIFVDQGHNPTGKHNTGAQGNSLFEQDITYNVGNFLSQMLEKDSRFQARVSRTTPQTVLGRDNTTSLAERVSMAASWKANYFLSVHANASEKSTANGTECYTFAEGTAAYYLAGKILDAIVAELNTKRNGVIANQSLFVLKKTYMPAVLIELAYITNFVDAIKLRDQQYQFSTAIYHGILNFFGFK